MSEARLLILDDDPHAARLVEHVAISAGYATRLARDADDFVRGIQQWNPTHVLINASDESERGRIHDALAGLGCPAEVLQLEKPFQLEVLRGVIGKPRSRPQSPQSPQSPEIVGTGAGARKAQSILLVEDDVRVRDMIAEQLEFLGYDVLIAEHGGAALDIIRRGAAIDLLFTDVAMPGDMNGLALARATRALLPALKVLYCSGLGDEAVLRERDVVEGPVLSKPFRLAQLESAVREALGEGASRQP